MQERRQRSQAAMATTSIDDYVASTAVLPEDLLWCLPACQVRMLSGRERLLVHCPPVLAAPGCARATESNGRDDGQRLGTTAEAAAAAGGAEARGSVVGVGGDCQEQVGCFGGGKDGAPRWALLGCF